MGLVEPSFKLSTIGRQAFPVAAAAAAEIWNALSDKLVSASFVHSFRQQQKTFELLFPSGTSVGSPVQCAL